MVLLLASGAASAHLRTSEDEVSTTGISTTLNVGGRSTRRDCLLSNPSFQCDNRNGLSGLGR